MCTVIWLSLSFFFLLFLSFFFRSVDSLNENQTCSYCMRKKKEGRERKKKREKTRLCRYLLHFCFSIMKNTMTCVPLVNHICTISLSKYDTDDYPWSIFESVEYHSFFSFILFKSFTLLDVDSPIYFP
jgi:hypothetical protein